MGFKVKCVPVLDRTLCGCCSCDLKVSTCILGWLRLIVLVAHVWGYAVALTKFEDSKVLVPQDYKEVLIAKVTTSSIGILFAAPLLYGAHTEKPHFMMPTVIVDMIGIVILAVAVLVVSIFTFLSSLLDGFIVLLVGILIVVLSTFFWVIIYSYYRKLEERQYPFPAKLLDDADEQATMHIDDQKVI